MITIERLNLRAEGTGQGVTVARALPGEVIEGNEEDGRIAQPRVVTPSDQRVSPPCRHYKSCGGCALMHASDPFVADWKQQVVRQALTAQGLDAPIRAIHTSPRQSRRRAVLAGRRLKSGALVGFHARASDTVTAIPDCQLLDLSLLAVIPALEEIVTTGGSRKGEVKLTVTAFDQGVEVAASGGKPLDNALRLSLPQIAGRHGLARLTWDGDVLVQQEPPTLGFGLASVSPPPGAFLQATQQGEEMLLAAVIEAVGPARRIVDLFAGCGTFSLPLAEHAEVHAVEGLGSMLASLDRGWREAQGLKRVTTETRDLFRRPLMPDELARFDAVVIDPPRAGAEAQIAELARAKPAVIAALSCNPVSFARDARVLVGAGYALEWIEIIDQFRWSAHIEIAAKFSVGEN